MFPRNNDCIILNYNYFQDLSDSISVKFYCHYCFSMEYQQTLVALPIKFLNNQKYPFRGYVLCKHDLHIIYMIIKVCETQNS